MNIKKARMINERFAAVRAQATERSEAERHVAAKTKSLSHGVITVVLVAFALWSAFVIVYPVLGNGWMYRIGQPVPVVAVLTDTSDPRVLLGFDRYAMWTMEAVAYRELHCDSVQHLPPLDVLVEAGQAYFVEAYPFLHTALDGDEETATCHYVGALAYRPFGEYGPQIIYEWKSENFFVDGGHTK